MIRLLNNIYFIESVFLLTLYASLLGAVFCFEESISYLSKIFSLFIATVATGAFIHAGWRRKISNKKDEISIIRRERVDFNTEAFPIILWIGWLGLMVVAWVTFGQGLIWDLGRPMVSLDAKTSLPDPKHGESNWVVEPLLAVAGLVIAVVTGYYLVILHQVTGRAESTLEFLKTRYEKKLNQLEEMINSEAKMSNEMAAREITVRTEVLIPILTQLTALYPENDKIKLQNSEKKRMLLTDSSFFKLSKAESGSVFKNLWTDLKAYEDQWKEENTGRIKEPYHYFFSMVDRTFDRFLEAGRLHLSDPEVREIADELQTYANQFRKR